MLSSLPDTSTFGVNSPQMAQIRAQKTQNDPKSKERYPDTIHRPNQHKQLKNHELRHYHKNTFFWSKAAQQGILYYPAGVCVVIVYVTLTPRC